MAFFEMNSATKISYDVFPNTIPTTTVFLHGNLSSNRWWIPSVEMLKAKYATISDKKGSIVCVEFRGCGKSSDPKSESEVTMQNFANDFIMLIRYELGPCQSGRAFNWRINCSHDVGSRSGVV